LTLGYLLALHSFPTRRSSDLSWIRASKTAWDPLICTGASVAAISLFSVVSSVLIFLFLNRISVRLGLRLRNRNLCVIRILLFPSDRKSTRLNSSHVKIWYAVF